MEQKLNIYPGRERNYELELKRLEKAMLSAKNKELISRFHNYLFSTGSGNLRVSKLSSHMRRICPKLRHDLDEVTKEDLLEVVALYSKDPVMAHNTKADYKRSLKQFYRWFKEEDKRLQSKAECAEAEKLYKFLEKELKTGYKQNQADPNTIISDEDCAMVIEKGCKTAREKAYISLLHETGCRAGEFLNIKIGDIRLKENHAEISVDGKTGKRTIFIVKSLPHLLRYLDVHPYKDNTQSYLWLSEAQFNRDKPVLYKGAQKIIDRCFERAGVAKKHNLHWFRHSRATLLAPKLTEAMLCKYMGWTIGSEQVITYAHLSVKQLEDVMLTLNGVKPKEEEAEKPIKCICGSLNSQAERYCYKCFKPLRVETMVQDTELVNSEINKTVQFMMEMAKNPEMMKAFENFRKSIKSKENA